MIDRDLHEYALSIANNNLRCAFDMESYIVKYIAEKSIDKVPESNIDEQIDDINALFITYINSNDDNDLLVLLRHIRQMISELYHTCDSETQVDIFKKELELFTNIAY